MQERDPNNMMRETSQIVNDLDTAINQKLDLPTVEFDEILVCGMGGSAIGGDIVADCLYPVSEVPIKVIRFPDLPNWAGERSLVIVSSYSGNTRETLTVYRQAVAAGCKIIAVTSGGELMDLCAKDGVQVVTIKTGLQPRNAVGYTVGYMFNIINTVGGPGIMQDIRQSIPELRKYVNSLKGRQSEAQRIAEHIHDSVPVIYSTSYLYSVAGRWRAQFNENAKLIAFDGHIPDTNHSDIVGLTSGSGVVIKPVLLVEDGLSRFMKDIVALTTATLRNRGLSPYTIRVSGKSTFERIFRATLLGDFISLHLAFFDFKDPSDVGQITRLKKLLSTRLSRSGKKRR